MDASRPAAKAGAYAHDYRAAGFTLIEMLTALVVFGLASTLALVSANQTLSVFRSIGSIQAEIAERRTIQILVDAAASRPVSGESSPRLGLVETGYGARLSIEALPHMNIDLPPQWRVRTVEEADQISLLVEETILASAVIRVTAPRDCRFDATGRRCL